MKTKVLSALEQTGRKRPGHHLGKCSYLNFRSTEGKAVDLRNPRRLADIRGALCNETVAKLKVKNGVSHKVSGSWPLSWPQYGSYKAANKIFRKGAFSWNLRSHVFSSAIALSSPFHPTTSALTLQEETLALALNVFPREEHWYSELRHAYGWCLVVKYLLEASSGSLCDTRGSHPPAPVHVPLNSPAGWKAIGWDQRAGRFFWKNRRPNTTSLGVLS